MLEEAGPDIGAVTGVQGISWTRNIIAGTSNHAGTTPMRLQHDAGDQMAICGVLEREPNLVNVIARRARVTVDLKNTDDAILREAERRMAGHVAVLGRNEGVEITATTLARFAPVEFDAAVIALVADTAKAIGRTVWRMPSGAGHDAQMFAPNCPTTMIFVPSKDGISHNVPEIIAPAHILAGADVLLHVMLSAAGS